MLKVFSQSERKEWDNIVRSFNDYDVYYLSGYVEAFRIHGDGEPRLFYYESGSLRGINVVMLRDIAKCEHFKGIIPEGTLFDIITPYGYGGWLLEGKTENKGDLFAEYEEWCRSNNVVSEFVRFHPVLNNVEFSAGAYDVIPLGHTVTLDITSPEIIWANIPSKSRSVIRKAEKSGVEIFISNDVSVYKDFKEIYNKTMEHDQAKEYYFFGDEFYESVCRDLTDEAAVFYAVKDQKIIAASIMLAAGDKLNYHLSGSLFEYRNFAPTNLLLYKAALWGCEKGCKKFHLGGGVGSGEDSLFKFKKSFYRGDDLTRFSIGRKIFIKDQYDKLVEIRGNIESNFFPVYRA